MYSVYDHAQSSRRRVQHKEHAKDQFWSEITDRLVCLKNYV